MLSSLMATCERRKLKFSLYMNEFRSEGGFPTFYCFFCFFFVFVFFNKLSEWQTSWRPSVVMLATNQKYYLIRYLSRSPIYHPLTKEPEDSGYEISNGIRLESCAPFSQQQESHKGAHTVPSPRWRSHRNFSITAAETRVLFRSNMAHSQFYVDSISGWK